MNNQAGEIKLIHETVTVSVSVDRAFYIFVDELRHWWPNEYTWSGEVLDTMVIEPKINGRCFERGPHGFECDWGRVLAYSPPERLIFTWQIGPDRVPQPDPKKSSEIEVQFEAVSSDSAIINFEHQNFDKHGEGGPSYREAMASPQGWPYILNRYKEYVDRKVSSK